MGGLTVASGRNFPIRVGNLTVRLAASTEKITAAQSLRYRVFYEEMNANPSLEVRLQLSDVDSFDEICDHLLVICEDRGNLPCGVVIDSQFNATDVSIIVKTNLITKKEFQAL